MRAASPSPGDGHPRSGGDPGSVDPASQKVATEKGRFVQRLWLKPMDRGRGSNLSQPRGPLDYQIPEAMPTTARLNDIVEALEIQFDESSSFLDRETGQVQTVAKDLLRETEESADCGRLDLPEWQKQEWEVAKLIVSTDRFLKLPSKFDVHEWAIMEKFSQSVESDRLRAGLQHAIQGTGAFRNFKHIIRRDGIEAAWYVFRTDALRQIALDWCEENQIVRE